VLPRSSRSTPVLSRAAVVCARAAAPFAAALLASCGDAAAPARPGAAVAIEAASSLTFAGEAGSAVPTMLEARVTDVRGRPVPGVTVTFAASGAPASLAPGVATTDEAGIARTRVELGTLAGELQVDATVPGVGRLVRFSGIARPGPLARLAIVPRLLRLRAAGDSALLRVDLRDRFGNTTPGGAVAFASLDGTVASADQAGMVRAVRVGASTRIVARAGGHADTALVSVSDPLLQPCAAAEAAVSLRPGEAAELPPGAAYCVRSGGESGEYALIPFLATSAASAIAALDVIPTGVAVLTTPADVVPREVPRDVAPALDERFDRRLRASERHLGPRLARAARLASIAAPAPALAEGQLLELNANSQQPCIDPDPRVGRVVAVTQRTIVVADTANPAGGFTNAEYRAFGVAFDTLVYPVAVAAFGAPHDIDGNDRAIVFFTRAVNELSPASSALYVGGFFWSRDYLPASECAGSNAGELFYMLVPDPDGLVRDARGTESRAFRKGFVDSLTIGVLAHEYQHLINASRHLFVNRAPSLEESWLNEGLSHVAEELVFYRASGIVPGANLGAAGFLAGPAFGDAFAQYAASNIVRLRTFLQATERYSPFADEQGTGTSVQSRGASWAFLRYLADQRAAGSDVWWRLVNSQTVGFANLRQVFGVDPMAAMRDWATALYLDDATTGVAARYTQSSWNFRDLFPALPLDPRPYPLTTRTLRNESRTALTLRAGSAAYLRFATNAGQDALLQLSSGGNALPPAVQLTVVRLK
jgi:hypothetical protein